MNSKTVLIDLKVNRDLIDPKFESYRLTSQDVPVNCHQLVNPVEELTLEDKQLYSYLHYNAFSKDINYLYTDSFDCKPVAYYCDSQAKLWQIKVNPVTNSFDPPKVVFSLDGCGFDLNVSSPNDSLVTLSFPSPDLALILYSRCVASKSCPGELNLLLVSTGNRENDQSSWSIIDRLDLNRKETFGPCFTKDESSSAKPLNCPTKLMKSYCPPKETSSSSADNNAVNELEVILLTVVKNEEEKHECLLSWLTLVQLEDPSGERCAYQWTIQRLQQLNGPSYPSYLGIDLQKSEKYLSIVSEAHFKFFFDSDKELPDKSEQDERRDHMEDDTNYVYLFSQTGGEITVDFKLTKDTEAKQVKVNFDNNELEIFVRGERVFKEKLWAEIDKEGCTWTLDKSRSKKLGSEDVSILQITLTKKDETLVWAQLIKTEEKEKGFEIMSNEEKEVYRGLSLLASEMGAGSSGGPSASKFVPSLHGIEPCDQVCEDLAFSRYDCRYKQVTHQANLGGHQWLFNRIVKDVNLPSFVIRHDIDALVWQPVVKEKTLDLEHIATFSALGYVQASKEAKKFINCSPDFEYAFIADSTNHVYIYRQPSICEGLTNRKMGQRAKIAKQRVINLGHESIRILGSEASVNYLILLSQNKVFSIKIDF